ncbi:Ribophorin I-domain-containing protein [Geranomyces variabilis]|nr:Ribophorin I-domain-containing protein [Geranomyces variabilis]KAJ3142222.1 proteasome regulatory particle base subunit [Geranomyces variabilis]
MRTWLQAFMLKHVLMAFAALIAVLAILAPAVTASTDIVRDDFINSNLHRILDLTNPSILREHSTIVIKATNDAESRDYFLAWPAAIAEKSLATVEVEVRTKKNEQGIKAAVLKDRFDVSRSSQLYKVKLPNTLKKDETVYLILNAAYTHAIHPFPKQVEMKSMQHLEHQSNAYFWSPYLSEYQKTTVRMPNPDIIRYNAKPSPVTKNGNIVTYGPYSNVAAYERAALHVHYADPKAILVVKSLVRKMELSHLGGNFAVQEDYELHHEGAKLKGHFSRVDYGLSQWNHPQTNVVKDLTILLPPGVKHVFYRDTIGNVSTSHFRQGSQYSLLNIRPRYPIYGGWKYTWHHGYNVPTNDFVKQDTKNHNQFVLRVPFIGGLPNVTISKAVLSIVFPEGAKNFKIRKPFDMDGIAESTTHTYLDTSGRPTITFEKHNVVDEHGQAILINYEVSPASLLQKPIAVSLAFLGLFFFGAFYSRLDLSIARDPKVESEQLVAAFRATVSTFQRGEQQLIDNLSAVFKSLQGEKRLSEYKAATSDIQAKIRESWATVANAAKQLEHAVVEAVHPHRAATGAADGRRPSVPDATTSFSGKIKELQALQEERLAKICAMHEEVVRVAANGAAALKSEQRQALEAALKRNQAEIDALGEQIRDAGARI